MWLFPKDRFKYLEAKYWIYWQGPESVSEYIYQIHFKKAVFVSSLIIIISGYILNEGWMSVLFLILAIFICIPYWLVLIFMGDNFRHQDKISSVLIKDIFTDKVFQYCVKFVLLWQKYCYFLFFLLHALHSCYARFQ